jgi:hypothetical protein
MAGLMGLRNKKKVPRLGYFLPVPEGGHAHGRRISDAEVYVK